MQTTAPTQPFLIGEIVQIVSDDLFNGKTGTIESFSPVPDWPVPTEWHGIAIYVELKDGLPVPVAFKPGEVRRIEP